MSTDTTPPKETLYLSFDIEADGPTPGVFSMRSIGMVGLCIRDGKSVTEWTFERNLAPLEGAIDDTSTVRWFFNSARDAWEYLNTNVVDPQTAMRDLNDDLIHLRNKFELVPCAWPAAFDWQYLNYYMWKFVGTNPLGYNCICMGSYLRGIEGIPSTTTDIDSYWDKYADIVKATHTFKAHRALDDALLQGLTFMEIIKSVKG